MKEQAASIPREGELFPVAETERSSGLLPSQTLRGLIDALLGGRLYLPQALKCLASAKPWP
jgi:hypothetical protein